MSNPYQQLVNIFREEGSIKNPTTILLGTVISSNPLKIKVGNLQLTRENFYIADYLLQGYTREVSVNNSTPNVYKTEDTLKEGDSVAVIPIMDMQTYIVLAKVV